ncbi:MAG: polysaccharide deacetylase family protein [Gaiellaceae bacterium]
MDGALPALAAHVPALARAYGIERRLGRPDVALTFDDGPHAQGTPAVLAELARHGATATFFLVGEQVDARPALAREIVDAGHQVAVHGYRHRLLLRRRVAAVAVDLDRAAASIEAATGVTSTLYRPPYGVFGASALEHVRGRGWRPLLWSRWGRDWEARATPGSIARRATRRLRPGDVVLLHDSDAYSSADSWRKTVSALPFVLDAVAALDVDASSVSHAT